MSSDEAAEVDAGGERVSHDDNSDGDVPEPSRGRKRTRNPAVWKKNVAKHKRNVGEAYISVKTNRHVAARAIGPPCADGCFDRVGREGIRAIFEAFWALGDYELQNAYIQKLVKTVPIKRKRTLAEVSRRSHTFLYSVMINGASHSVCKRGFASMHGLSLSRVESASKKMTLTGTLIADKRGRRVPQNKIVGMQADRVREHIKLLPAMSCHYSRFKAPHRRYLDSSLTIKKLYDSYVEWMEKEHSNEPFVTFSYYSDVFTKEFNICFAPPDSDTCTTCDTLNAAIKNDAENLEKVAEHQMNLQAHKAEADEAQNLMKIWKNNDDDDVRAVAVDLQQTLPTPRLSAGISYYKRKMWTYNLCIFNLKTEKSTMYVWNESVAKRGSVEIASCLKDWVFREYARCAFEKLVVFSDNCGGQNKNINMVLNYLHELHCGRIQDIKHIFLVPGHTFMGCDRSFGLIEKRLKRHGNVVLPRDYCSVMKSAASTFTVEEMDQSKFLNLDLLKTMVTRRRATASTFKNAKMIILNSEYKEGYVLLQDYDATNFTNATRMRLMPGRDPYSPNNFNLSTIQLTPKYDRPLRLDQEKVADIRSLYPLLSVAEQQFYENIFQNQEDNQIDASNDDEDHVDNYTLDYHKE